MPPETPLQSKRHRAYLIGEATWFLLILFVLIDFRGSMPLLVFLLLITMVVSKGFMQAYYLAGQAGLDKYTKIAAMAFESGGTVKHMGMEINASKPVDTPAEPVDPPKVE